MNQEEKSLLLQDLCTRLPYGVICNDSRHGDSRITEIDIVEETVYCYDFDEYVELDKIRPYLRPMSSMTEEERKDLEKCTYNSFSYNPGDVEIRNMQYQAHDGNSFNPLFKGTFNVPISNCICTRLIDWLNAHHFDYRGLIEKGLALEAPKGMYD